MAPPSFLTTLENLQRLFQGKPEVDKLAEKDFQWVNDVVEEATALFNKTSEKDTVEEDDENEDQNDAPVLLPQTPRVIISINVDLVA